MRPLIVLVTTTLVLTASACSGTAGSGSVRTQVRSVSGFSTVELTGVGDVLIDQTGAESLTVEAEDSFIAALSTDVTDGVLRLGTRDGANIRPIKPVTFRLTVKTLAGLRLIGSGTEAATSVRATRLEVDISGSGTVTARGSADAQVVTISGSGDYRGTDLATRATTATITGSGDAAVRASDSLTATVSGSGHVTYSGDPRVTKDVSGSGSVTRG